MSKESLVRYWLEKAEEDLGSALDNLSAGRLSNSIRDAYFACFHAFSAVLMEGGRSFRKHKEVRSALHRDYVHKGRIEVSWGKHYDWLFENRQKADYRPMVQFDTEQVNEIVEKSGDFVNEMKKLLGR